MLRKYNLHSTVVLITPHLVVVIGFLYHIYRVEERELTERFGESFIEYRLRVSGLYVWPPDLGTFFRLLVGGGKPETPDTA